MYLNQISFMTKRFIFSVLLVLLLPFQIFASGESAHEAFDLNEVIVHHLMDNAEFPFNIGGVKVFEGESNFDSSKETIFTDHETGKRFHFVGGFDMHITKRVTMMWIVALLLFLIFIPAAKIIARNPLQVQSRFANTVEVFVNFLRKDIVDESMHGHGHGYYHYILTLFFFILFCNLMGLVPSVGELIAVAGDATGMVHLDHHNPPWIAKVWSGITVTGDISVTMTLALLTMFLIYAAGFIYQGPKFIWHSVPNGVPLLLYIIMWPLEFIVSPMAKTFALTVRLLANMTAGHVIILALMGFIFQFQSWGIVPVSVIGSGLIYVLEIFVAFLQAYIFVLLTSLFVGLSMHRH
ncbi:F0F1 ATP synthase subunit A [Leptospira interrogans]|nr:F0F1 ATP synthase subunit A [Leptospira interrogans]APH41152.1 ATP synthase subunit a [Leptospira interrogans serovar Copenhageni/Icterohaemorrhagiae]OCC30228.1 ATP synthase subunit a [Leptospira interrogans serovar Canicola]ALO01083.1 F0F1 ATP synthase subunit A [Leptospira interrogans serovar Hardjo-prajitno]KPA27310.1 ATP synthase subunit a [Leptospira interrogans]KPA34982.1 ATP synthase subunit a [Leptospira interrogans]